MQTHTLSIPRRIHPLTNPRPLRQLMHPLPIPLRLAIKHRILVPRQHFRFGGHLRFPAFYHFHGAPFRCFVGEEAGGWDLDVVAGVGGEHFALAGAAAVATGLLCRVLGGVELAVA